MAHSRMSVSFLSAISMEMGVGIVEMQVVIAVMAMVMMVVITKAVIVDISHPVMCQTALFRFVDFLWSFSFYPIPHSLAFVCCTNIRVFTVVVHEFMVMDSLGKVLDIDFVTFIEALNMLLVDDRLVVQVFNEAADKFIFLFQAMLA